MSRNSSEKGRHIAGDKALTDALGDAGAIADAVQKKKLSTWCKNPIQNGRVSKYLKMKRSRFGQLHNINGGAKTSIKNAPEGAFLFGKV
jgi:hypothetical protein